MKTYLIWCESCKKQTPHYVFQTSRNRGLKLSCMKCGHKKNKYHKLKFLSEIKELRDKDRNGSYFELTKDIFNQIFSANCPKLAFLSSQSSQSSQSSNIHINNNNKCDDT